MGLESVDWYHGGCIESNLGGWKLGHKSFRDGFSYFMVLSFPMSRNIGDFAPLKILNMKPNGPASQGRAWHGMAEIAWWLEEKWLG